MKVIVSNPHWQSPWVSSQILSKEKGILSKSIRLLLFLIQICRGLQENKMFSCWLILSYRQDNWYCLKHKNPLEFHDLMKMWISCLTLPRGIQNLLHRMQRDWSCWPGVEALLRNQLRSVGRFRPWASLKGLLADYTFFSPLFPPPHKNHFFSSDPPLFLPIAGMS